jgi:chromosomal replication initiation ATPase DnaA
MAEHSVASDDRAAARVAMDAVGFALGLKVEEIAAASRRTPEAAFARHVAMYVTHVAFEMSLSRVAIAFDRDRSTVGHACHVIEDRREDPAFDAWIAALEGAVADLPRPAQVGVRAWA